MKKIKILAIAPYKGMADTITKIAQSRNDIELNVQIGDLDTGKKIVKDLAHQNYDIIISRGGTAELIRSSVDIPVIDISISGYDILRAIKLAEGYFGKFVIAGFPGITKYAHVLCDLLQYDIDIITFTNEDDALPALRSTKKSGCTLVLCDMTGANAAKKLNMNSILISSGEESINDSINDAIKLVQSSHHVHKQKDLFQTLLTDEDREFLIYDPAGSLWFSSFIFDNINLSLMNLVQTYLKAFIKIPNQTIARQIRDKIYTLTSRHLYYAEQKYTAIIITQKNAIFSEEDMGITIYNKVDSSNELPLDYYSESTCSPNISSILEQYSKTHLPILILGECGTEKDKFASLLYENSPFDRNPFYTINCSVMNERKWNYIITSENSPLNALDSTIYIKNPNFLSKTQLNKLFSYINQTNLDKRNRLIFSLILNPKQDVTDKDIIHYLENHLSCLTLKLPSLRERISALPSIIALCLHKLNISLGKQIIGLESEAMELMSSFPWPNNFEQLQHVLKELAVITNTPYITYKEVKYILKQESSSSNIIPSTNLDLSQTLDDINYQIIQMVLKEENGNKEKTSQRLGISRSTLWRILKNYS